MSQGWYIEAPKKKLTRYSASSFFSKKIQGTLKEWTAEHSAESFCCCFWICLHFFSHLYRIYPGKVNGQLLQSPIDFPLEQFQRLSRVSSPCILKSPNHLDRPWYTEWGLGHQRCIQTLACWAEIQMMWSMWSWHGFKFASCLPMTDDGHHLKDHQQPVQGPNSASKASLHTSWSRSQLPQRLHVCQHRCDDVIHDFVSIP